MIVCRWACWSEGKTRLVVDLRLKFYQDWVGGFEGEAAGDGLVGEVVLAGGQIDVGKSKVERGAVGGEFLGGGKEF